MKKIFVIAFAVLVSLAVSSCEDFLDVTTENAYTADTYFTSDQQAIDAVDMLSSDFEDEDMYSQNLHWDMCTTNILVAAREGDASSWFNNFKLNYAGNTARMPNMYSMFYKNIARANWVISSLYKKCGGEVDKLTYVEKRSLGEAIFYRAHWHYLVAYRYGCATLGVPFIAYEDIDGDYDYSIPPQQATVMDNYSLIIKDLQTACDLLPKISEYSQAELGRPQKEACLAMQARIYAYWATFDKSKWDNVITVVEQLRSMGRSLTSTYEELFTAEPSQFFSSEYCWGFPVLGTGKEGGGIWFEQVIMHDSLASQIDGWGEFNTSRDMYVDFLKDGENNDRLKRSIFTTGSTIKLFGKDVTIQPYYGDASPSGYWIYKWCNSITEADGQGKYWQSSGRVNMMFHVVRFADCLLYEAEAYLVKGDAGKAKQLINEVRRRSNLADVEGTWESLYHERRCELAYEGNDYMYDVKRWAYSGDAAIKALAIKEIEGHAKMGVYEKDSQGNWVYVGEDDYALYRSSSKKWEDFKICFPYPQEEIVNSNGALTQNPGY